MGADQISRHEQEQLSRDSVKESVQISSCTKSLQRFSLVHVLKISKYGSSEIQEYMANISHKHVLYVLGTK